MNWRVVISGAACAAVNMATDEAMMQAHGAGNVPPTLRFYGWRPAAVSIGYFQRAAEEIDLEACRAQGVDVVRRLTGGRAVLHDAELTYSIVVREDHPHVPGTITESYCLFSRGLVAGLRRLGVEAKMSVPGAAYGQNMKRPASSACFDAPSHYEITVEGRKLVGSAQVRKDGVVLQHGSILLRFSPERVVSLLRVPSGDVKTRMVEMLRSRAISLTEALGREAGWQELCDSIMGSFGPALGINLEIGDLTEDEIAMSRQFREGKYGQDSWNLLR